MFFPPKAMPDHPVEYPLLPSGPHVRWWRVLLGIPVLLLSYFLFAMLLVVGFAAVYGLDWLQITSTKLDIQDPPQMAFLTLSLVVGIPAAYLAHAVSFGVKPGFFASVAGKMRWSWLAIAFLISTVFSTILILGSAVVESGGLPEFNPNPQLLLMLVLIVCFVPLQSAAEEYVFRGYIPHVLSALLPFKIVSLMLGLIVSSLLFGAAHGSFDPATFTQLASFGVAAWILTYRTGGLEAAIAFHAMNNTVIFTLETFVGVSNSLVGKETVTPWSSTLIVMASMVLETLAILWAYKKWEARKSGRTHLTNPALRPVPSLEFLYNAYLAGEIYPEHFAMYPPAVQQQLAQHPQCASYFQQAQPTAQQHI